MCSILLSVYRMNGLSNAEAGNSSRAGTVEQQQLASSF